jgi:ribosomal protein S18 acetylase RimI-like enzyme
VSDLGEAATAAAVVLRPGTADDAAAAARLHAESITEGFLAGLGTPFLSHLYRRVVRTPESFLLVAEAEAEVVGFVAGSLDLRGLYRSFILHDGIRAAVSSLPRLLGAWPRAWETLRHGVGAGPSPGAEGELLAIAVDRRWRRRRVGALLVDGFVAELDRRDVADARVVVGADNAAAIDLYQRAGFGPVERFELHRGTFSLLMRRPPARTVA